MVVRFQLSKSILSTRKEDETYSFKEICFFKQFLQIPKICNSPNLSCVETLESEKQCAAFDKAMEKRNEILDVLIQVNTSDEENKGGGFDRKKRGSGRSF